MPEFRLGFAAFALAHPEVGEPVSDEYQQSADFVIQKTTTGFLVYNAALGSPAERAIGYLEKGTDAQATDAVNLRVAPSISADIIALIAAGTAVHVLFAARVNGDGHDWSYCHAPGAEGWIAAEYLGAVGPADELTNEPDHLFTFEELWPYIERFSAQYGMDAQVHAGIVLQESGFRNWRVHTDGTGHGLYGYDDHGLLGALEAWSGQSFGRGASAAMIPPILQIEYAALKLADYSHRLGGPYNAASAWHRGEGAWDDAIGQQYADLIRAHVVALFG